MSFLKTVGTTAVRVARTTGFRIKKYSPEILLVGGIGCVIAGVVVACKQTPKAEEVIAEATNERKAIDAEVSDELNVSYTEEVAIKDIRAVKRDTAWKLVKTYAPVVGLEALGITCILCSYGILHKRNVVLLAAYEALDDRFKKYRERAQDLLGKERERMLNLGVTEDGDDIPPFDVYDKDGNPIATKKGNALIPEYSQYAVIFDEANINWKKDPLMNKLFLESIQSYCNDYLRANGHLFLNQVYEWLGFEHTPEGAVCGWLTKENGGTDGYVNLGIWNTWRPIVDDFQHGYEKSVILDPNVDGVIWDKI